MAAGSVAVVLGVLEAAAVPSDVEVLGVVTLGSVAASVWSAGGAVEGAVVGGVAVGAGPDGTVDGVLVVVVSPPAGDGVADDVGSVAGATVGVAGDGSPLAEDVGVDVAGAEPREVGLDVVVSPVPEGADVVPAEDVEVEAAPDPVPVTLPVDSVVGGDEPPVDPVVAEPVGPDVVELLLDPVVDGSLPSALAGAEGASPKLPVALSDVGAEAGFAPADGTPLNGDG